MGGDLYYLMILVYLQEHRQGQHRSSMPLAHIATKWRVIRRLCSRCYLNKLCDLLNVAKSSHEKLRLCTEPIDIGRFMSIPRSQGLSMTCALSVPKKPIIR